MSLVNIGSVQRLVLQMLDRREPPAGIELLSYKRNRSVSLRPLQEGMIAVRERGYVEQEITVSRADLPRTLKTLIKREFPRSRKVRVNRFADPDAMEPDRKIL